MVLNAEAMQLFRALFEVYELDWDGFSSQIPVLAIMGESDYAVPATLLDGIASQYEHLTFKMMPGTGHTPQLEQPHQFDRLLIEWLGRSTQRD